MIAKEFLLVAGNTDDDQLAASLVRALGEELTTAETGYGEGMQPLHASLEPRFYGAGGRHMADAGVELVFETGRLQAAQAHPLRRLLVFRRSFEALYRLAIQREPHAILCVGFFGFNLRLARAVKHYVRHRLGTFNNWNPFLIQLGIPPRWAARTSRVQDAAQDFDCLLSLEPSDEAVYARHAPGLRFQCIGPVREASATSDVVGRAAQAVVQLLLENEALFPLRAYLSSRGEAAHHT